MTSKATFALVALLSMLGAPAVSGLPLWEVEGTTNTILLMGSIHYLRPTDYPLPPKMTAAFETSDVLVMELDMSRLDLLEAAMVMERLAVDPNGKNLADFLGPGTYREARSKAASIDIDLSAVQAYEPWFAALQITQLRVQQLGYDASYGIEYQFLQKAMADSKEIRGLESIEEQLTIFDELSMDTQKQFLMQTLDEATELTDELDEIIAAWRTGDTETLERLMLQGMQDQAALYSRLIIDRNANWVRQIADMTNDRKDYLIVVGALHLVGNDSVLKMLKKRGYSSRQIR